MDTALFAALSDPNRVRILTRLATCRGPLTVGEAAACCSVDLSVVSRHLAILREAGALTAEKRGRSVYYRVRFDELVRALRLLADAIERCCPPASDARGHYPPGPKTR